MSKAMEAYKSRVFALGCAICRRVHWVNTPPQLHHQRTGTGAGRRASDSQIIPLCERHHTGAEGLHGMGRKAWERKFGVTELELVAETQQLARCPE